MPSSSLKLSEFSFHCKIGIYGSSFCNSHPLARLAHLFSCPSSGEFDLHGLVVSSPGWWQFRLTALRARSTLLPASRSTEDGVRAANGERSMSEFQPRRPRLRLNPDSYRKLRTYVLERDGWRCQSSGSSDRLQVHHMRSRSILGDDTDENLITLCTDCHSDIHRSCITLR